MSAGCIEQIVEGGRRTKKLYVGMSEVVRCRCVDIISSSSNWGTRGLVRFLASDSGHVIPKALNPSGRLPCRHFSPWSRIFWSVESNFVSRARNFLRF